jgi:hypothetical protein
MESLLWPGRTFGLFCQQVPRLSVSNPSQFVAKRDVVYVQQRSNAYVHNKSPKKGGRGKGGGRPVQILSRVGVNCSVELEVWSEFELI